jgi:glycosyltransferase involved in cell wall biosynthesis
MENLQNKTFSGTSIKVSVLIITYNHEKFITQAIESVLNQRVNFDYEIIISEDFSTDNTRNIVLDFQAKYPEKIKLLLAERNFNSNSFFIRALQDCQGTYIALLEGDDYWNSPLKLQNQVDFLDKHPECSICFHDVTNIYEDGSQTSEDSVCIYRNKEVLSLEDLLRNNFCYTCTTMFRRGLVTNFPDWYSKDLVKAGDYPFFVFHAQCGRIGYIHEVMGAYRHHAGGIWSSQSEIKQLINTIGTNKFINEHLNFRYKKILKSKISYFYYKIAINKKAEGDILEAAQYIKLSFFEYPFNKRASSIILLKELIGIFHSFFFEKIGVAEKS